MTGDSSVRQRYVNQTSQNETKKPDNSAFKQQRLPAWQPVLTAKSVLPEWIHNFFNFSFAHVGKAENVITRRVPYFF